MNLQQLYSILNSVLPDKVFYATNTYDNNNNAQPPFIVYQEISKRAHSYSDDKTTYYIKTIQITLVTKKKNQQIEETLEQAFRENNINYSMITESHLQDKTITRVYEIKLEEI